MVLHDDVDEIVHRGIFVADEDLAVQHLVVTKDVVDHLLVNVLRWCREGDLHAACFLGFEIDIGGLSVESDAD